jgi:hypothetical protein
MGRGMVGYKWKRKYRILCVCALVLVPEGSYAKESRRVGVLNVRGFGVMCCRI